MQRGTLFTRENLQVTDIFCYHTELLRRYTQLVRYPVEVGGNMTKVSILYSALLLKQSCMFAFVKGAIWQSQEIGLQLWDNQAC